MDLHPGEELVFEGHPSWRAVLGFYLKGLLVAIVIGVVVGVAALPGAAGSPRSSSWAGCSCSPGS